MIRLGGWFCVAVGVMAVCSPAGWWLSGKEWRVEHHAMELSTSPDGSHVATSFIRTGWAGVMPFCFEVVAIAPAEIEAEGVFEEKAGYWVFSQPCPEVRSGMGWKNKTVEVSAHAPSDGTAREVRAATTDRSGYYRMAFIIK